MNLRLQLKYRWTYCFPKALVRVHPLEPTAWTNLPASLLPWALRIHFLFLNPLFEPLSPFLWLLSPAHSDSGPLPTTPETGQTTELLAPKPTAASPSPQVGGTVLSQSVADPP